MNTSEQPGQALKTVIPAFLASRIVCLVFVYTGHLQRLRQPPTHGVWQGIDNWWLNPWTTYDSLYYLTIARSGYVFEQITTAFFPLYPLLLNIGGRSESGMAVAGIIISNLCFLGALYFLYTLTTFDFGKSVAQAAVWLLAFFPTTVFFSAVYTESLFLFLALASFHASRQRHWSVAGFFGLLAALTRNPGLLLFLALLLEYLQSHNYRLRHVRWMDLLSISLPLVGFAAVQAFFWSRFGSGLTGTASQQSFYRTFGWPWEAVWKDSVGFFTFLDFDLLTFLNLAAIGLALTLMIHYHRELRPSYALLLGGIMLMNLCYYIRIPPHSTGTLRYLSTAFPFVQLMAILLVRSPLWRHRRAAGGIYFYVFLLFSFLFGVKYFLG